MNIDLHNHVIPQLLADAIIADPAQFSTRVETRNGIPHFENRGMWTPLSPAFCDIEAKLEWMDRCRIDVAALSVGPPVYFYYLPAAAGLAAARLANDGIAKMVAQYPQRFRGMAHLPMQDPDAAVAELERVVREHGFKAVELGTSIEGEQLADPKYRKVLKAIEQAGCFVFTHPYQCVAKGGTDLYYLRNFVGFPLDTTIMISNLMFSGALDDLTTLRFVFSHGGGYLPYQLGRYIHGHRARPEARVNNPTPPAELFKRFYFDALLYDGRSVRHLIEQAGADHVVLGSDHPFDMCPPDVVGDLDTIPGLTAEEREWISSRTALTLFGELPRGA